MIDNNKIAKPARIVYYLEYLQSGVSVARIIPGAIATFEDIDVLEKLRESDG